MLAARCAWSRREIGAVVTTNTPMVVVNPSDVSLKEASVNGRDATTALALHDRNLLD